MDKTAIQTAGARLATTTRAAPTPRAKEAPLPVRILKELAALRITVVLMALSILLVFFGTLAQMDEGIWTVLNKYFRTGIAWIPLQIFVRFGQIFFGFSPTASLAGKFLFPGGWLLGGLLLVNLLAAHGLWFVKIFSKRVAIHDVIVTLLKRSGILLIHAGLIVIMLGEVVAGLFQVEGNMIILEGQTSNYLLHQRYAELAVVDGADSKTDDVVVVPDSMLRKGEAIHHEDLPFDVAVIRYMENSDLVRIREGEKPVDNPATKDAGLASVAIERPIVSGAQTDSRADAPSAYVTLKDKKDSRVLGTYLVSVLLAPQPVEVNGKTYELALRYKRTYKPYSLHLIEFSHDLYIGTPTPKNYSSLVRLVDPTRNEDREVLISMNDPLRHGGETFYQSSVYGDDEGTVLQVVRNPGWLMPYIACVMVALGMLIHFGIHLVEFLRRVAL